MSQPAHRSTASREGPSLLHITATVDRRAGGPINGILQQAADRQARGIRVTIASLDLPDAEHVRTCPVTTIALGERPATGLRGKLTWPLYRYGYSSRMVPWLRENLQTYDMVLVEGLWNYSVMAARRTLVGSGHPYVVFTHGMLDPWFKKTFPLKSMAKQLFWIINEGPLLNNAAAVLFTTEDERQVSKDAFWPYRIREKVASYGSSDIPGDADVQAEIFRTMVPALEGRRYLLFLSRIHVKKGCDLLIEAFAKVAARDPGLDLVIAGPDQTGWQSELEVLARRLGVADRIHWPGMLTGDAKWGAYRACEAFILPSHQENFGVVVAEALAAGKPVLISDKVQIWREIKASGAGLVETDTVEGTVRLLDAYLALDEDARKSMSRSARATFLERYEIAKVTRTIDDILSDLMVQT